MKITDYYPIFYAEDLEKEIRRFTEDLGFEVIHRPKIEYLDYAVLENEKKRRIDLVCSHFPADNFKEGYLGMRVNTDNYDEGLAYFEKQGYIAKVPVDGDGRKKQIIVTEEGKRFNQIAEGQIMAVDDYVTEGIPEEQIKLLVEPLETMRKNAADYKSYIKLKKED